MSVYARYHNGHRVAAVVEDGKVNEITITLRAARIAERFTVQTADRCGAHVFVLPCRGRDHRQPRKRHFTRGWDPERSVGYRAILSCRDCQGSNRAVIEPIGAVPGHQRYCGPTITASDRPDGGPLAGAG